MRNMVMQGRFGPVLTIIGKDLDAGATFNSDMEPGLGLIPAGRLIAYDEATKRFHPTSGGDVFGILADECNASDATNPEPAMVYRRGVFLRQEVETVNEMAIPPDQAVDRELRALGIYLEWSYTDYIGLEPEPPGVSSPVTG